MNLILVEGETDALTLWFHGYAALGLPGASNIACLTVEHVAGFDRIYVISETDAAGAKFPAAVAAHLRDGGFAGDIRAVAMGPSGFKDPSALHIDDPRRFRERFDALLAAAVPVEQPAVAAGKRIPIPARAPFPLAEAYVKECAMRGEDRMLHHWDGRWWTWDAARYIERIEGDQRAALGRFIRDRVEILVPKGERAVPQEPTSWDLNNAIDALKTLVNLPMTEIRPPVWLGVENGQEGAFPAKCVAVQNGIVELGSGNLRPPSPRWFAMDALATEFDAEAECPEWLQFLERTWNDQASIETLQEMFGYFLTPDNSQQKAFMVLGPRRSGKGTIGRVIEGLLGNDAVARPTLADFGQQFGMEQLIGRSVAIVSDARLDGNVPAGMLAERILGMSGEDNPGIPRKYLSTWKGSLNVRLLMLANEVPRFRDPSGALPGRFIILRMRKSWFGQEDPELFGRLRREMPGILNWAIEGWLRLMERGKFVQPDEAKEDVEELAGQANPLGDFLDSECERADDARVGKAQLYKRYLDWCKEFGAHQLAMPLFFRDLQTAWPEIRKVRAGSKPRELTGIRLVAQWEKMQRNEG